MISKRSLRAGLNELEIFDNFQVDYNLPKHKKETSSYDSNTIAVSGELITSSFVVQNNSVVFDTPSDGTNLPTPNIFKVIWQKLRKPEIKRRYTIKQFFTDLHIKSTDLKYTIKNAEKYENALQSAKENGQIALLERLQDLVQVIKYESILLDLKQTKYVTEQQVINFYNKLSAYNKKHLRLDWIKNFGRIIPSDVINYKKEFDNIFDNYVILHYDPEENGYEMTKAEKEKKKDPILFGVLAKSRKLYYIADWKDEYCDLTLDKMFEVLGEDVLQINNNSVNKYINTGKL